MPGPLLALVMYYDVDVRFHCRNRIFYVRAMKFAADGRIYNYEQAISEELIQQADVNVWQRVADRIVHELDLFRKEKNLNERNNCAC